MRINLILLFAFFLSARIAIADERDERISRLIVPGKYEAEILVLTPPPDVAASMREFELAMLRDPVFFKKYVEENFVAGTPLPYHEKMGISKAAYERINSAKSEFKLLPIANCELTITETASGILEFSGTDAAKCLNGLRMDPKTRSLSYHQLKANDCNLVEPKKTAIASISGVTWTHSKQKPETEKAFLYLSIGQYVESPNRIFINFICKRLNGGVAEINHEIATRFAMKEIGEQTKTK